MNNRYLALIVFGIAFFIIGLYMNIAFIGVGSVFLLAGLSSHFREKRKAGKNLIEGENDK